MPSLIHTLRRVEPRDCPLCGTFATRCHVDLDDGNTVCGITGEHAYCADCGNLLERVVDDEVCEGCALERERKTLEAGIAVLEDQT